MSQQTRVAIVQRFLPQYRKDFYNLLRERLHSLDIDLILVYGDGNECDRAKGDLVHLQWAHFEPTSMISLLGHQLYWQPVFKHIRGVELVIVEQANRMMVNYLLMVLRKIGRIKLAFWGHGLNRQSHPNSLRNRFKRLYLKQCDWWFAYTEGVAKLLTTAGFPPERITVVQNAIDTLGLVEAYRTIPERELRHLRQVLDLDEGPVGIFCGGLYAEKRIDFLILAGDAIKRRLNNFQLLILGAGPERSNVVDACSQRPWIKYVGPVFGVERVRYFKLCNVLLMPGLVGLVILDSFALQVPLITTNYAFHSPEIEYLVNGVNGLIVDNDPQVYAESVAKLLRDSGKLAALREGCAGSAEMYTLECMVDNFAAGVLKSLESL